MSILQEYEEIRSRLDESTWSDLNTYLYEHPNIFLSDVYYSEDEWKAFQEWRKKRDFARFLKKKDMLNWGYENLSKNEIVTCFAGTRRYLLCGTNLAYEDEIREIATEAIQKALDVFGLPRFDEETNHDFDSSISKLQELIVDCIQDCTGYKIGHVSEEY